MKLKNLFQFYFNYKARKLREKAINLAIKTNRGGEFPVIVAKDIENYIKG